MALSLEPIQDIGRTTVDFDNLGAGAARVAPTVGRAAPTATDFVGSQALTKTTSAAAARAAAARAASPYFTARAAAALRAATPRLASGLSAGGLADANALSLVPSVVAGTVAGVGTQNLQAGLDAAAHPLDFIGRGLGQAAARLLPTSLGGLPQSTLDNADAYNVSAYDQPDAAAPAPAAPASPAVQPNPAAAPVAAQPATPSTGLYKIQNADGSVSYSNVPSDATSATAQGQNVAALSPELSGAPGAVTGTPGTFNVVPSTYTQDHARLDSLIQGHIAGGDLERANALAVTPEQHAAVDAAYGRRNLEAAASAGNKAAVGRLAQERALDVLRQQGINATDAAQVKGVYDAMVKQPENDKNKAEAAVANTSLELARRVLANPKDKAAARALSLLKGNAPDKPVVHFTDPMRPGDPPQVTEYSPGDTSATNVPIGANARTLSDSTGLTARQQPDGSWLDKDGNSYTISGTKFVKK